MQSQVVRRTTVATGAPIPEMIGGAIMGALTSLVLTYIDWIQPMMSLG